MALVIAALLTPGFLSRPSLAALMSAASIVGCAAIGMSFVTISGNVMSFSLGVTASATSIVFMAALAFGLIPALLAALAFGAALTAAQGFVVGWLRANPIIVSMAAFALILGASEQLVGAKIDAPNESYVFLKGRVATVPIGFLVFLVAIVVGQAILGATTLGHHIRLVGSNRRAAQAAGVDVSWTVTAAYALSGAFTALAGILLAIRYDSGDMEAGSGYEYQAIAAVLAGGIAIGGGKGSIWRALLGVLAIAVMNAVVLLHGFNLNAQRLVVGLAVLLVVMLQALQSRR